MIKRYDMIVRVDESSSGYYVSFDDIAHLLPHKGNDLPEDEYSALVTCDDGKSWEQIHRDADGFWRIGEWPAARINLSRVTHWMRVPEVET